VYGSFFNTLFFGAVLWFFWTNYGPTWGTASIAGAAAGCPFYYDAVKVWAISIDRIIAGFV
jgi:hypothetical protein